MIKNFFKVVLYQPLFNLLVFFAWLVPGHSIGWAIILLTVLVRLILWPTSVKALKTPLLLRQHQDEMKVIQDRYKDDRNTQAQALMAFYKEKGVNPLSGCLPLLIQLPIILILYRVFIAGLKDVRTDLMYSFIPHLSSFNLHFLGFNLATPDKTYILPILAGLIQFVQTRHMQSLNPTTSSNATDPTAMVNKQMLFLFPLMTVFIALRLPAGLSLYWVTTTLFGYLQQLYVVQTFRSTKPKVAIKVRQK